MMITIMDNDIVYDDNNEVAYTIINMMITITDTNICMMIIIMKQRIRYDTIRYDTIRYDMIVITNE